MSTAPLHQRRVYDEGCKDRWVRPSTPDDGLAIVELMREAGLEPHVDPLHLYWKYWQERPDWPGSRSFLLTNGRDILAHAAVVPGTCQWDESRARVLFMIDWAARRSEVGAGVFLMKHLGSLADYLLAVGGSTQALQILPRIGYQPCGVVTGYVRAISPLQLLKRPSHPRWRVAPRVARSVLWNIMAPSGDVAGWEARRLEPSMAAAMCGGIQFSRPGSAVFGRSVALFRHLLGCPIVPMELLVLERQGQTRGYVLLSYAPGQARLVDCWLESDLPEDWRALISLAVREAQRKGGVAELVTWSSDPMFSEALSDCGFHSRMTLPILLRPSGRPDLPPEPLRIKMVDGDAAYLYIGDNQLWA